MIDPNYSEDLVSRYPSLSVCKDDIDATMNAVYRAYAAKKKVLVCGNGGSAADAEHIVGELLKGFARKRPLDGALATRIKERCHSFADTFLSSLQTPLPAIALTSHLALSTAFNNDVEPALTFAQQLLGLAEEGDVLIALSTSGNSKNILYACELARALGVLTIGMTGESGGKMAELCDVVIRVPETVTYKIQELHLPIYHALCLAVEAAFFAR